VSAIAHPEERRFSRFVFGLMAAVTFVGILSEMVAARRLHRFHTDAAIKTGATHKGL
jgi:steroid 5-alpha reductase family enzyme